MRVEGRRMRYGEESEVCSRRWGEGEGTEVRMRHEGGVLREVG